MNARTAMLGAVLVGVVASGCSGGDAKPRSLPPVPTAASPTSPSPEVPLAARGTTSQALDAFVRFYFEQLNLAFSTSDASIVRRYSDPICETCNKYAESLAASPEDVIQGESFGALEVAAPPVKSSGTLVDVFGVIPARTLVKRDGTVIKKLPTDGRFHFVLNVIRTPSGWLVRGIKRGD